MGAELRDTTGINSVHRIQHIVREALLINNDLAAFCLGISTHVTCFVHEYSSMSLGCVWKHPKLGNI